MGNTSGHQLLSLRLTERGYTFDWQDRTYDPCKDEGVIDLGPCNFWVVKRNMIFGVLAGIRFSRRPLHANIRMVLSVGINMFRRYSRNFAFGRQQVLKKNRKDG